MRVANILSESVVDGPGIRTVVFLQGCPRICDGCHNKHLLNFDGGTYYDVQDLADEILENLTPLHRGVTFSGGEPLAQADDLMDLIFLLRRQRPQINIWVYTGFDFVEVKNLPVLKIIDVLKDGPFIKELADGNLTFCGSSNQRLLDVPKSLAANEAVLLAL